MKNRLITFFLALWVCFPLLSQESPNTITGIVTDPGQPLAYVNISIKGTANGAKTDTEGKYTITAKPMDILVFSHVGMKTVEIFVEDVTETLNIQMAPNVE